jgi:energy-coupling factor transporter ATP-binding protein EcfA2
MSDTARGGAAVAEVAERLAALARRPELDRALREEPLRRARQLRDHLVGHVLPRARSLDSPLLILLIGPTGAGKSSLLNALAGFRASPSGVIRPTTRDLVVVTSPGAGAALDASAAALDLLAGDRLKLVESDRVPEGIALVDSPDIDSIEHANRELTDRLAEAADLGIFVTTAIRYADRVPWDVLGRMRDRGLPLIVVVNRMPADPGESSAILADVARLLADAGVRTEGLDLVAIPEGAVDESVDGIAAETIVPIRERIDALGADRDARRALAARALAGSLAGLAPLVQRVADDAEHAAIEADALRRFAKHAFESELGSLRDELATGAFLRAEALRQWQAFVGADEITRFFSTGIGKLRGTLSALIRGTPPAPIAEVREDTLADLGAVARAHAGEAARRTATSWSEEASTRDLVADDPTLWSPSPGFDAALRTRLEQWMSGIADDVQRTGGPKRTLARGASLGVNVTGVGVMLATFAHTGGLTGVEVGIAAGTAVLNQKLLEALFGEAALHEMIGRARRGLGEALEASFAEEEARYERLVPEGGDLRELADSLREAAAQVTDLQPTGPFEPAEPVTSDSEPDVVAAEAEAPAAGAADPEAPD